MEFVFASFGSGCNGTTVSGTRLWSQTDFFTMQENVIRNGGYSRLLHYHICPLDGTSDPIKVKSLKPDEFRHIFGPVMVEGTFLHKLVIDARRRVDNYNSGYGFLKATYQMLVKHYNL